MFSIMDYGRGKIGFSKVFSVGFLGVVLCIEAEEMSMVLRVVMLAKSLMGA